MLNLLKLLVLIMASYSIGCFSSEVILEAEVYKEEPETYSCRSERMRTDSDSNCRGPSGVMIEVDLSDLANLIQEDD